MVNVIMHGCNGTMGKTITRIISEDEHAEVVAGIDVYDEGKNSFPVFKDIFDCDVKADVIIDFCAAPAVDRLLDYCLEKKIPCVLCTTGLSDAQIEKAKQVSEQVAILKSANMSVGINLLMKTLKQVAPILAEAGFDIEIVEKHHRKKLDAPSGTALALADAINDSLEEPYEYVYDRSNRREQRPKKEIGLSAVRGGTIVGDHDIIFAGEDEVITFSHMAYSKAVFGKGAVEGAKFLKGKPAGYYTMADVMGE